MKKAALLLTLLLFASNVFSQEKMYTGRKGSKFFPGHYDVVVTVNATHLKYELFHHWYAGSYAQVREMNIPLEELEQFNATNDSLQIRLAKNGIRLNDKKYKFNKTITSRSLCASKETMRKISYAVKIARENKLQHSILYHYDDLKLPENEFREKVNANLKALLETTE